jgi:hypothetical protein
MRAISPIGPTVFSACLCISISALPAEARMPNPYRSAWVDHTKGFSFGADAANQVFATGTVTPLGNGKFRFHLKCEHNDPGRANAAYTIQFLSGLKVLHSYTKRCNLLGSSTVSIQGMQIGKSGGDRREYNQDLDLSRVINRIDSIELVANYTGPF